MDPSFFERYRADLPNLQRLAFSRLATTTPPQSPVAWSTFITGLDPAEHGIFDFVHRDPATHELFLSTDRTLGPRFTLPLGRYQLPLSPSRVESLRHGKAFWQTLSEHGVPVNIVRIPANYPPLPYGNEISGMETPDLRGTQSTFTFFTDDPAETSHAVSGGLIRKVDLHNGHAGLILEGPPNSLARATGVYAAVPVVVDVDAERPAARFEFGDEITVLRQGEWSPWLPADFPLIPHLASVHGMVRIFVKQLHPRFEIYVSPINIDPRDPALPVSSPPSFAKSLDRFYTIGIPEDTSALRQGVFNLPEFLTQSREVLKDERRLLDESLDRFTGGFLFFYFSSVDQNSHILFGKHDGELLEFYKAIDSAIGEVMRRQPDARLIVMSDHGFSTFDRAVNLNTWLLEEGLLARDASGGIDWANTQAYAVGLNALYLSGADKADLRRRLLALRDPANGKAVVETATEIHASPENQRVAPDLIVGYSPGYRASWQTGLGEVPETVFEDNTDAWIADHCINAADVPGVLFTSAGVQVQDKSLKGLSRTILKLFGAS
jgi:predicted AlkP superfamily phosphohydrolase/phosphomutase